MEISYLRNLNGSRMVIKQAHMGEPWERKMLQWNPLSGVLTPDSVCEDGEEALWYDITGMQALDVRLDTEEVDYEMLLQICGAILAAAEQLEKRLLSPDAVLLKPECIFMDNVRDDIRICCCLGNPKPIEEAFGELMQYLLKKLNHKDAAAVEAGYRLFEETSRAGYSMREIPKLLSVGNLQKEKTEVCQEEEADLPFDTAEPREEQGISHQGYRIKIKECLGKGKKRKESTFISQIQKKFRGKREKILETFVKKKPPEAPFVFEPEEEEPKRSRPTILLSEISHKPQGILKYEGTGGCMDMKIEGTAYIIGSDAACDGVLPKDTISRRHAKITRKEDVYFIEDLNSSNGTFVGGELLNCRVKMSLQCNEIVMFADEKFRFI